MVKTVSLVQPTDHWTVQGNKLLTNIYISAMYSVCFINQMFSFGYIFKKKLISDKFRYKCANPEGGALVPKHNNNIY